MVRRCVVASRLPLPAILGRRIGLLDPEKLGISGKNFGADVGVFLPVDLQPAHYADAPGIRVLQSERQERADLERSLRATGSDGAETAQAEILQHPGLHQRILGLLPACAVVVEENLELLGSHQFLVELADNPHYRIQAEYDVYAGGES